MADENVEEHWFTAYWRPAVAWGYLFICLFDFFVAPILLGWYSIFTHVPYIQWDPLTLKGGGMLHLSMGGIAGVSAWSRGREKMMGMELRANKPDDDDWDRGRDRGRGRDWDRGRDSDRPSSRSDRSDDDEKPAKKEQ